MMFWSGNYIVVRELNFLLKEENVSLTQVLEADDILQECKADNKALIQFLTRPEILAELVTLITEEPPKNVDLTSQYRHASIACEVLTSQLSMLSDRLSMDTVQMNRLCDFINREPPLNPLLASYFSKTVEMLLERSPKQDWYLYHIVCLRVLDFFKSRRDFLPNLLRHLATSAIADTFKYFIRLDDLFNKIVMEWLEEHQFLECLIQIICGTYVPEPLPTGETTGAGSDVTEGQRDRTEKLVCNHNQEHFDNDKNTGTDNEQAVNNNTEPSPALDASVESEQEGLRQTRRLRMEAVAAANAAGLLVDLVLNGCLGDACTTRARTGWALLERLADAATVRRLLGGMFTSPPHARAAAIVNGCHVLLALLRHNPVLPGSVVGECGGERSSVELGVAPHLPLLHQALLHDPAKLVQTEGGAPPPAPPLAVGAAGELGVGATEPVGAARIQVAALLAALAASEVEEVATTMLTLGTPGVLVELFLRHPHNNFLHAQVYAFLRNALDNKVYRALYAHHLLEECDLLTRLIDVYEENETKKPRDGYMGHVPLALGRLTRAVLPPDGELSDRVRIPTALAARATTFRDEKLKPALQRRETPLGGYYPSENIYEVDATADSAAAVYDYAVPESDSFGVHSLPYGSDVAATLTRQLAGMPEVEIEEGEADVQEDALPTSFDNFDDDHDKMLSAKNNFLELVGQRFDENMWADGPEADGDLDDTESADSRPADVFGATPTLAQVSPWESESVGGNGGGEGWAQFGAGAFPDPVDPFAAILGGPAGGQPSTTQPDPNAPTSINDDEFWPNWSSSDTAANYSNTESNREEHLDITEGMASLHLNEFNTEQDRCAANSLANNLLSAMSGMAPDLIANIVNANAHPHQHIDMPTPTPTSCDVTSDVTNPITTPTTSHGTDHTNNVNNYTSTDVNKDSNCDVTAANVSDVTNNPNCDVISSPNINDVTINTSDVSKDLQVTPDVTQSSSTDSTAPSVINSDVSNLNEIPLHFTTAKGTHEIILSSVSEDALVPQGISLIQDSSFVGSSIPNDHPVKPSSPKSVLPTKDSESTTKILNPPPLQDESINPNPEKTDPLRASTQEESSSNPASLPQSSALSPSIPKDKIPNSAHFTEDESLSHAPLASNESLSHAPISKDKTSPTHISKIELSPAPSALDKEPSPAPSASAPMKSEESERDGTDS